MKARRARCSNLLVEVILVLAIGYVVFSLIRAYLGERYTIPTASMEPTLHGDRNSGDVVLVDKTAWWWKDPRPFDMVVVRSADSGQHHIVKRMIAIGPADVRIDNGDIFVDRRSGAGQQRIEKDPVAFPDLRIELFRHGHGPCAQTLEEFFHFPPGRVEVVDGGAGAGEGQADGGEVVLQAAAETAAALRVELEPSRRRSTTAGMAPFVPGLLATHKGVDASYLDPAGRRRWQGSGCYADIGLELDLTPAAGADTLVFVHEYRDHDLALMWGADGRIELLRDGTTIDTVTATGFAPGVAIQVAFGYLDGHLFLVEAGARRFYRRVDLPIDERQVARRSNGLQFGVCGGSVRLRRITVFRDLAASNVTGMPSPRPGGVYPVEPQQMFLLGDNPHDSSDSRTTLQPVPLDRLVGRPFAIIAPSARARIFPR